jgi:hypothetical protein
MNFAYLLYLLFSHPYSFFVKKPGNILAPSPFITYHCKKTSFGMIVLYCQVIFGIGWSDQCRSRMEMWSNSGSATRGRRKSGRKRKGCSWPRAGWRIWYEHTIYGFCGCLREVTKLTWGFIRKQRKNGGFLDPPKNSSHLKLIRKLFDAWNWVENCCLNLFFRYPGQRTGWWVNK